MLELFAVKMHLLSKQKPKAVFTVVIILYSTFLFLPSPSAAALYNYPTLTPSSSSYYDPPYIRYIQQSTELQTTTDSNKTESDNITIGNTVTFLTPDIRINYPATWNAFPGVPTSPYVDSVVTFTLLPQNNNNITDSDVGKAILNIAKHALFHEVVTLEEYVGTQLYFLRNTIPGFNLLQFNTTTLDGRPAYEAVYTGLEGSDQTKTMKLWVKSGSFRYIVTYSTNVESFPSQLETVRNMISSFKMTGAQAPPEALSITEGLEHIPESSREKVVAFANALVLSSVFDNNLVQFMEGSSTTIPENFTKLPVSPTAGDGVNGSSISAYYYITPSYLSPKSDNTETNKQPYKLLILLLVDNISNRLITGTPIDYRVSINGTNFNFAENGTTTTGADIKVLTGSELAEALKNNQQQYSIKIDV
jgi:hypothetical protein